MTFAVINTGGKQYKVFANDEVVIEKLPNKVGDVIQFKEVLLLNNNDKVEIGTPNITGAKVEAKVLQQRKNKTILVFKKRRRQNSRKKYGHRQHLSKIQITKILSKGGKVISEMENKKMSLSKEQKSDKKTVKKKEVVKNLLSSKSLAIYFSDFPFLILYKGGGAIYILP